MNEGEEEWGKGDFSNAIYFLTEGIKVKCKDDELNARLHGCKAEAHYLLGKKTFIYFSLV